MRRWITPRRAVFLSMTFFLICAITWAIRVPVVNGIPDSFNSDEPSHFLVVRYISETWSLPPYTRDYYESAHPPLSDYLQALYIRLWPASAQVYALRFLAALLGLVTIGVVYKTAQMLVSAWSSALCAAIVSALPMFIMFSASVTNDPLAVLLSSVTLSMIVKCVTKGLTKKELNVLCLLVGLAGITKYTLLGLAPVAMAAVYFERKRRDEQWLVPLLSIAASFILISGWWYLRNAILFGDIFRSQAEAEMGMFAGGGVPNSPSYWLSVVTAMTSSFLGLYHSFPKWPSTVYGTVTVIAALILFGSFIAALRNRWSPAKVSLAAYGLLVSAVVLAYQINHFQPHGRLLFPAITVIVLAVVGLDRWIPPEKRVMASLTGLGALACLSVALVTSPI